MDYRDIYHRQASAYDELVAAEDCDGSLSAALAGIRSFDGAAVPEVWVGHRAARAAPRRHLVLFGLDLRNEEKPMVDRGFRRVAAMAMAVAVIAAACSARTSDPEDEAVRIAVFGGSVTPRLVMTPGSGAFGTIPLGTSSAPMTFTVTNTGALQTSPISVAVSDPKNFAVEGVACVGRRLRHEQSCTLLVRFTPSGTAGPWPATLSVAAARGGAATAALDGLASATVTVENGGGGRVTSNPAGVDCGATCGATFTTTPVTLIAIPDAEHSFAGWSGVCSGTGACSLPMDSAIQAVTAKFVSADLSVLWLVDTPRKVLAGAAVTYTIRVHNAGPDPATGTVLTDTLAPPAIYLSSSASEGSCASSGMTVTCSLGTLPSGADATVAIVVSAGVSGEMTNHVSVDSAVFDPAPDDNAASLSPSICDADQLPGGPHDDGELCPAACANGTAGAACSCAGWALAAGGFCCSGPCCSGVQGSGSCTVPSCGGACQAQVPSSLPASQILIIDRTTVTSPITAVSSAVRIPRGSPISLRYTNNSITAQNGGGYMLEAGTEVPSAKDNRLDGSIITGNRLVWTGTDLSAITHAMFVGYGVNHVIEYNFLQDTPYGIVTKSSGMTFTSGGVAYNIVTNSVQGAMAKGMNGVRFYNNTFYNARPASAVSALVKIYENKDAGSPGPASTNAQVMNNIFYTRAQVPNIRISESSRPGFQSDHNVFFCESGEPIFEIEGQEPLTFTEWQALGYDTHSVIVDPHFVDTETLVPSVPLEYGADLGPEWTAGLSPTTVWGADPILTEQGPTWQCGAYVVR